MPAVHRWPPAPDLSAKNSAMYGHSSPSDAGEEGSDGGEEGAVGGDPLQRVQLVAVHPSELGVLERVGGASDSAGPPQPQGRGTGPPASDDTVQHHLADEGLRGDVEAELLAA